LEKKSLGSKELNTSNSNKHILSRNSLPRYRKDVQCQHPSVKDTAILSLQSEKSTNSLTLYRREKNNL